jgi:hypothetical protein
MRRSGVQQCTPSLLPRHGAARRGRVCGSSSTCSPGADVGGVSPVPVQMWVDWVSPVPLQMWVDWVSPVPVQMWAAGMSPCAPAQLRLDVQSWCRCGRGEPKVLVQMWAG